MFNDMFDIWTNYEFMENLIWICALLLAMLCLLLLVILCLVDTSSTLFKMYWYVTSYATGIIINNCSVMVNDVLEIWSNYEFMVNSIWTCALLLVMTFLPLLVCN